MQNLESGDVGAVKYGLVLALLTLFYGFALGGAFGANEAGIKGHLKSSAREVFETVYKSDEKKMEKVTQKSWVYFKRAHLHANGLGTSALVLIMLLAFYRVDRKVKMAGSLCIGAGALGYSLFWMFAGLKAPCLGSTGKAKEALEWLAVPSAGLSIIGLLIVMGATFLVLSGSKGDTGEA